MKTSTFMKLWKGDNVFSYSDCLISLQSPSFPDQIHH